MFLPAGILFLGENPFVLQQADFAQNESADAWAGKVSPRFFSARRGTLPNVKQGIARGEPSLMPAYNTLEGGGESLSDRTSNGNRQKKASRHCQSE